MYSLIRLAFVVGIFSSQFYVFDVGMPQPSHFIILLFSALVIYLPVITKRSIFTNIINANTYKYFLWFMFYAISIDMISSLVYQDIT
ncbi:hypothetical protein AB4527_18535, partial [Vibrio breoganii]